MIEPQLLKMQRELLECAQGELVTEDALRKWFKRYVHEFGASTEQRNAHSEGAIDENRFVREKIYSMLGEELCRAEAAAESLEEIPNGHVRKARLFVLFDPSVRAVAK